MEVANLGHLLRGFLSHTEKMRKNYRFEENFIGVSGIKIPRSSAAIFLKG